MTTPLLITGIGAVTAVGLNAVQTCAAVRAGLSGFRKAVALPAPQQPILGAVVPASRALKRLPEAWLVNLAARVIGEALPDRSRAVDPVLLLVVPDTLRRHPGLREGAGAHLIERIGEQTQIRFDMRSRTVEGGAAEGLAALPVVRDLLLKEGVRQCVIAGVDSLVNRDDLSRLRAASRLHGADQPQGVVPGEGAACIALTIDAGIGAHARAQVLGAGAALEGESETAIGPRYSVGIALQSALEDTVRDAGCDEASVDFRVSDMNGERYRAWESTICAARFYRTRRERLAVWYPAMSVGEIGAAAGVLGIAIAARALERGYAPGPLAMCEASSDGPLRAACVVAPAPAARRPPFRSIE